ncbi:MAG: site-specific integrase [Hyphomicrobiales bacterium]|nr:site-specific integrase [Hyphomicrobiales bacterium]
MSNRKTRITKRIVDSLNPRELIWDTDISGFAVRCQRQSKTYALKTRVAGRQRWFTIGRHGNPWTPDTARKEALAILAEIASGKDPATKRDAESKIPTVQRLARRFLTEEVETKRKAATIVLYSDFLKRIVLPKLGRLRADQVRYSDIAGLHHDIRKTPLQANRVLAVLSTMFTWAERVGIRERNTNPCTDVKKYKEEKRERYLSINELDRVGDVLDQCETDKSVNPFAIAAIRLLIFTGCRRDEILTLQWEFVDVESAKLNLPDSKTGKKVIHLNAPALNVLSSIPRIEGNPYVICGRNEGARLVNLRKPWIRICKLAGIEGVRLHDLRHTFASVGASGGVSLQIIGKLLGQSQIATTQRYAHLAADPVKATNEAIGQQIASMMKGKKAEIVPIK